MSPNQKQHSDLDLHVHSDLDLHVHGDLDLHVHNNFDLVSPNQKYHDSDLELDPLVLHFARMFPNLAPSQMQHDDLDLELISSAAGVADMNPSRQQHDDHHPYSDKDCDPPIISKEATFSLIGLWKI